jgi:hypothetical protein
LREFAATLALGRISALASGNFKDEVSSTAFCSTGAERYINTETWVLMRRTFPSAKQDAIDLFDFAYAICQYVFVLGEKYRRFRDRRHPAEQNDAAGIQ